jgi:geranylgeranyl pyrophosphate synthase
MTDSDHLGQLLQLLDKKDSAKKDLQEAETKLVSIKSRGKNKTTARNYGDICKAELDSIVDDEQELRKRMLERKSKEEGNMLMKTVSGSP